MYVNSASDAHLPSHGQTTFCGACRNSFCGGGVWSALGPDHEELGTRGRIGYFHGSSISESLPGNQASKWPHSGNSMRVCFLYRRTASDTSCPISPGSALKQFRLTKALYLSGGLVLGLCRRHLHTGRITVVINNATGFCGMFRVCTIKSSPAVIDQHICNKG